jgi:urease accessory protein
VGGIERTIAGVSCWRAKLQLGFERRGERSVLAYRRHEGPYLVQKSLYPEGSQCCHAILLHPPGGIASGDELSLDVTLGPRAHAVLTTPGAAKWYRSTGTPALCETRLSVEPDGSLEWLPRESIVFDRTRARTRTHIELAARARCVGWELWCLGRTASGERFRSGRLEIEMRLSVAGRLRWEERGILDAEAALLQSAAGFGGQPVFATLWAAGPQAPASLLSACREIRPTGSGRGALTQLPEVLIGRFLGTSTEEAFTWLSTIWSVLRPAYVGREALRPRIWAA